MMRTGPEHYREAERVSAAARSSDRAHHEGFSGWTRSELTALAQVHATLAQAAAAAYPIATEGQSRVADDWHAVVFGEGS